MKSNIIRLIASEKFKELIRFGIVGVLATIVHYGVYLLLVRLINESIAYSVGYAISFIGNFLASNYFTFKTKPTAKNGLGFAFSHLINYLMHLSLLNLFLWVGIKAEVAPIPVFFIVVPVNFILVRFFLKNVTVQK